MAQAFTAHLVDLQEAEFPSGLRRDFAELQAALSRVAPVGSESRIRASVQKMSAEEARGHATTILHLYVELLSSVERAEPLKVVSAPKKPPHYLIGRN